MKLDLRPWLAPLLAVVLLGVTMKQTGDALRTSGTWPHRAHSAPARPPDPYARLDRVLDRGAARTETRGLRDPFQFGPAPRPAVARSARAAERAAEPAAEPPPPVLTSIIWDSDPRATLRYDGRDFSVRENSLFADFRVTSITSTQVVLERNGEPLVLTLRSKGD